MSNRNTNRGKPDHTLLLCFGAIVLVAAGASMIAANKMQSPGSSNAAVGSQSTLEQLANPKPQPHIKNKHESSHLQAQGGHDSGLQMNMTSPLPFGERKTRQVAVADDKYGPDRSTGMDMTSPLPRSKP